MQFPKETFVLMQRIWSVLAVESQLKLNEPNVIEQEISSSVNHCFLMHHDIFIHSSTYKFKITLKLRQTINRTQTS